NHQHQSPQREHQIHHAAGNPGQGEDILGHIGLFQHGAAAGDGEDSLMGGGVHKIEQQLTAEQVHREIDNVPAEHGGKYDGHNHHDEQGVENAPHIAQEAAAVLELHIFDHQKLQKVFVFHKF